MPTGPSDGFYAEGLYAEGTEVAKGKKVGCFQCYPEKRFCEEYLFYTRLQAPKASASGQASGEVRRPHPCYLGAIRPELQNPPHQVQAGTGCQRDTKLTTLSQSCKQSFRRYSAPGRWVFSGHMSPPQGAAAPPDPQSGISVLQKDGSAPMASTMGALKPRTHTHTHTHTHTLGMQYTARGGGLVFIGFL